MEKPKLRQAAIRFRKLTSGSKPHRVSALFMRVSPLVINRWHSSFMARHFEELASTISIRPTTVAPSLARVSGDNLVSSRASCLSSSKRAAAAVIFLERIAFLSAIPKGETPPTGRDTPACRLAGLGGYLQSTTPDLKFSNSAPTPHLLSGATIQ